MSLVLRVFIHSNSNLKRNFSKFSTTTNIEVRFPQSFLEISKTRNFRNLREVVLGFRRQAGSTHRESTSTKKTQSIIYIYL